MLKKCVLKNSLENSRFKLARIEKGVLIELKIFIAVDLSQLWKLVA